MRHPLTKLHLRLSFVSTCHDDSIDKVIAELELVIKYLRERKPTRALIRTPLTHLYESFDGQYTGQLDFEWKEPV